MSERLIVNASPLIFLGNGGRLELLRDLGGGGIAVPSTVLREVVSSSHADRASVAVKSAAWIEALDDADTPASVALWGLDAGEAQVVATGLASGTARLVIDDLAGRKCALSHGLKVMGTLGVIVAAYRGGLIDDPARVFAELRDSGMWISSRVLERAFSLSRLSE